MVICDICKQREAVAEVRINRNGEERLLHLCREDYARFQSRQFSPLEAMLFGFGDTLEQSREGTSLTRFLSDDAKRAIDRAAAVASRFGRRIVDTEHLLYAVSETAVGEATLQNLGVKATDIRGYIDANSQDEGNQVVSLGLSPRVKQVMVRAFAVMQEHGHAVIGPEHLLVALLEEDEGMASTILVRFGVTPAKLKEQLEKEHSEPKKESNTPTLDAHSRDLTTLAKQGKLDPVIGRAVEIESTVEVLARRTKSNPVLIGEPGVGKTAVVEGLAQRIVAGTVPEALQNKRLVELSLANLVAGTRYRGDFEERIQKLLEEVKQDRSLILFIDELHTVVGTGAQEGSLDVANVLKPALARGEIALIGATTLSEYQKHIEKDAALERRFQPILVGEPTKEQAVTILHGLRDAYEAHHKVEITDEAIQAAVDLSDRYLTQRFLPDKAIDLLDQAAARVRIASTSQPTEVKELEDRLIRKRRELERAKTHGTDEKRYALTQEVAELEKDHADRLNSWKQERSTATNSVGVREIATVVSKVTGVPVTELTAMEREKLLNLEARLKERVIGQDNAVASVAHAVRVARAGLTDGRRPIASLLFVGPTGVGKTELTKALAEAVFGSEEAMIRLDMSEYGERHTIARMIGAPPGYVGHDDAGQLTEKVRRNPYTVVLLDEIEKAHPEVANVLLQILEDGRLTDGKGRTVDFSNTVVILTSNLGSELFQGKSTSIGFDSKQAAAPGRDDFEPILRQFFRPELINRLDEVVVFAPLSKDGIASIVDLQLARVARLAHAQGVTLSFTKELREHLAEAGFSSVYGARELRRTVKREVEQPLAEALLSGSVHEGSFVELGWGNGLLKIQQLEKVSA